MLETSDKEEAPSERKRRAGTWGLDNVGDDLNRFARSLVTQKVPLVFAYNPGFVCFIDKTELQFLLLSCFALDCGISRKGRFPGFAQKVQVDRVEDNAGLGGMGSDIAYVFSSEVATAQDNDIK